MIVGVALGVLIGLLSLVSFTLLIKTGYGLFKDEEVSMGNLGKVLGQVCALPTFWFGGPWLSSKMIATLEWQDLTEPYILALTLTFVPLALVLVVLLIAKTAGEMAQA